MPKNRNSDEHLVSVVCVTLIMGMAIGLGVFALWRSHTTSALPAPVPAAMLVVCPPMLLSSAAAPLLDSTPAMVLTLGTIVFANGFLYAGAAAGVYFLLKLARSRMRE